MCPEVLHPGVLILNVGGLCDKINNVIYHQPQNDETVKRPLIHILINMYSLRGKLIGRIFRVKM